MKSIISNERKCFKCGTTEDLHRHHIYFGKKCHKLSEKHGCWVYLCGHHHNMSNEGVHFDHDFDLELKEMCQEVWESVNGKNHDDFRAIFWKNYLD